ncbi:inner membrane protein YhjD [Actinomadura rubrobrunea]|uniref:Inner membrane protein YhjD n=1 Tax=Actinomadura rubrobrunea TaxID=115335 RepID=A0A9W6UYI6_9ACTN|nr:YihY/virulence factor BrkB family protein [Actinomadura rubrobrunea]GLW65750.1 inner membrane protein YhjD [Actinomadura rubrobrunea]
MRRAINATARLAADLRDRAGRLLDAARARSEWFDHLARAFTRYQERRGDRLAAALTCYAFLSFFPLLALAYALLGYLVGVSEEARAYFVEAVRSLLPGLADRLQVEQIARSRTAAGLLGLAGLLVVGLGLVTMVRESLREIWGHPPEPEANIVVRKLWDAGVLLFLGCMLIVGMALSAVAVSASSAVLGRLGAADVPGAGVGLWLLSAAVAVAANTVIFLVLFSRVTGTRAPWRTMLRGALVGAVGFEVLKQAASLLLGHTTSNPVYASFAVLVGLIVWINIAARYVLYVAAWTATRTAVLRADRAAPAEEQPAGEEPETGAPPAGDADRRAASGAAGPEDGEGDGAVGGSDSKAGGVGSAGRPGRRP